MRKANEVKRYIEYSLMYQVEAILPKGYEVIFSKSDICESSYLTINLKNNLILKIAINENFNQMDNNDEVNVSMFEQGKIRNMKSIGKEVKGIITNRLHRY